MLSRSVSLVVANKWAQSSAFPVQMAMYCNQHDMTKWLFHHCGKENKSPWQESSHPWLPTALRMAILVVEEGEFQLVGRAWWMDSFRQRLLRWFGHSMEYLASAWGSKRTHQLPRLAQIHSQVHQMGAKRPRWSWTQTWMPQFLSSRGSGPRSKMKVTSHEKHPFTSRPILVTATSPILERASNQDFIRSDDAPWGIYLVNSPSNKSRKSPETDTDVPQAVSSVTTTLLPEFNSASVKNTLVLPRATWRDGIFPALLSTVICQVHWPYSLGTALVGVTVTIQIVLSLDIGLDEIDITLKSFGLQYCNRILDDRICITDSDGLGRQKDSR